MMNIKYYISSPKRARDWHANTDTLVLGQRHEHDWVEFNPENQHLYNFWFTEKQARGYIERYKLEDCEVMEIEYCSDLTNNMSEDKWEDTEQGMNYYDMEYDPVLDEYV